MAQPGDHVLRRGDVHGPVDGLVVRLAPALEDLAQRAREQGGVVVGDQGGAVEPAQPFE
ncbi:hypothetical protein [Streptosporangium canum]|uniref:hypothetical protein n=1 Tax=Streptosporangium canum TaxID=324952 RepID=UPI0033BCE7AB